MKDLCYGMFSVLAWWNVNWDDTLHNEVEFLALYLKLAHWIDPVQKFPQRATFSDGPGHIGENTQDDCCELNGYYFVMFVYFPEIC